MNVLRSVVSRTFASDLSDPFFSVRVAQEFARDEVVVTPSIDRHAEILRANQVISSGGSIVLDTAKRAMQDRMRG